MAAADMENLESLEKGKIDGNVKKFRNFSEGQGKFRNIFKPRIKDIIGFL